MDEQLLNNMETERIKAEQGPAKGLELPVDNTKVTVEGTATKVVSNKAVPYGVGGTPTEAFPFEYIKGNVK